MAKLLLVFSVLLFFAPQTVAAQISFENDSLMIQKFDFEVKQLTEFFDRFNYKEPVKFADNLQSTRVRNIVSLLNLKDSALFYDPEVASFIKYTSNDTNKVYLNYADSDWFAFANCSFLYHGKNTIVDIIMKPEGGPLIGYKWVIADIRNKIFYIPDKEKNMMAFINPNNHEIGFSELSRALNKKNGIFLYTASAYRFDPLSAFLFMVKNNDIKFIQVNEIEFQFLQVNGWIFTVKNYNRDNYNSGWLISSIKKMDRTEKINYVKNHFIN